MENLNVFESIDFLEPKCPKCQMVLDYGVNTRFDEKRKAHVCIKCNTLIE